VAVAQAGLSAGDLLGAARSQGFAAGLSGSGLAVWGVVGAGGSMFWGMDMRRGEGWKAGIAFSEGVGGDRTEMRLPSGLQGHVEADVSGVYPYVGGRFPSGLSVWGIAGFGSGTLDSAWRNGAGAAVLADGEDLDLRGDLAFEMGLAGVERPLRERGGVRVTALGDVGWARLKAVRGTARGLSGSVSRTRFGLRASRAASADAWGWDLLLRGRHDGGDLTGASGADVSVAASRGWGRLNLAADGRAHTGDAGFGAQGARMTFRYATGADGTGLAVSASPAWGTAGWGAASLSGARDGLPRWLVRERGAETRNMGGHLGLRVEHGTRMEAGGLLKLYGETVQSGGSGGVSRIGLSVEGERTTLGVALSWQDRVSGPGEAGALVGVSRKF